MEKEIPNTKMILLNELLIDWKYGMEPRRGLFISDIVMALERLFVEELEEVRNKGEVK